jgi:hypothetical protein
MFDTEYQAKIAREGRPNATTCGYCKGHFLRIDLAVPAMDAFKGQRAPLACPKCRRRLAGHWNAAAARFRRSSRLPKQEG